jgi:hypothetical protein
MWLSKLYQRCLPRNTRRRRSPTPPRCGLRLTLEQLEDRTVPSSFTAASVSDLIADINAANAAGGSNTITLLANTTFTLTAVDNTTDGGNGLPVIAANDNLSIVGNGDIIQRSTTSGTPAFRLFDVAGGASLALASLTLQGGFVNMGDAAFGRERGGAVYDQGGLSLNGVIVQNNAVTGGSAEGGGIFSSGSLTVNASTIQNNQALGSDGSHAIMPGLSGGDATGGGILVWGGTASLTNVTLQYNTAQGGKGGPPGNLFGHHVSGGSGGSAQGGGMGVLPGTTSVTVSLHNCIVARNSAIAGQGGGGGAHGVGEGGGLFIYHELASVCLDAFTVANVTGNKASTSGNNIYGSYTICP